MSNTEKELNEYLNPLLVSLMGDSFDNLNQLYQEKVLVELNDHELNFFTKFIADAREFYADMPDRLNDLEEIDTHIKSILSNRNNG